MSEMAPPRITVGGILNPKRVAVFGASDDRSKWAGRIMYYLALHGFTGEVIPINPRRDIVQGKKCYPRIGDALTVDVAVIAIPSRMVPATLEECAAAGVGCCLIITSGFAEVGEEGEELQRTISDISRRTGMRLIGPNCLGLINVLNGMALTSARVLEVEALYKGKIGLITQSGAIMLSVFNRAHDVGIGFSQCISVGNQADLGVSDFLEHMVADPDTTVICVHVEGFQDARRFLQLARRAKEAGKALIVLKTGRSEMGEKAARSHTASLAGAFPVFEAACRETGITLVDDPDGMVLAASMIARFGALAEIGPKGGVGIVSSSGGINGITADRLAEIGFPIATFTEETRQALSAFMLPTHLDNPVDLGARRQELGEGFVMAKQVARTVASDPNVNLLLIPLTTTPHYEATVQALVEGALEGGKPLLVILTPGSVATGVREMMRNIGGPFCDRIDDGMRIIRVWRDYSEASRRPPVPKPERPGLREAPAFASGYLTEPEAKRLLASYGIPITREQVAISKGEAVEAAAAIGFPVVMKAVTDRVVHKSDAGLVHLNLFNGEAVARAWDEMAARLAELAPGEAPKMVVAEMVSGDLELIVGAKHDPEFGPVVLVGSGGILVDLLNDVQMALAPVDAAAAESLIRRLRIWPLFDGYRGRPRLDVKAAAQTVSQLSHLASDLEGRLVELDINPLTVRETGRGVTALDARAVLT